MLNPIQIEEAYQKFIQDLPQCAHDGIIQVDLQFLHNLGLLNSLQETKDSSDDLTQYFHVIESIEKVTLFNDQFIIWIIPRTEQDVPITYVLIGLNHAEQVHLEIVFKTSGIYNTPRYVLRILQHFLVDMLETEETLISIEKNQ